MRKLLVGLSISTLAFAASTIYFWRALTIERSRHDPSAAMTNPPSPAANPAAAVPLMPRPAAIAAADAPRSTPVRDARTQEQKMAMAMIDARKQMAAAAPAFLASLDDPQARAAMIADSKTGARVYTAGLQRYLGLSDETYDRLLDVLAELELTGREAASRCALDETCHFPNWDRSTAEARRRNALSQFGTDVADKYDFYMRSANERQVVSEFRGRLDDATRLTDTQSEKLVRALMEAHERIRDDLQKTPGNIGAINGVAYAEMDVGAQVAGVDRTEEISGYNRQLRDGAASVLSAAQLAAFEQMQAEALEQSRDMRRIRERAARSN